MARAPHLGRLDNVWVNRPIYFVTTCTQGRDSLLGSDTVHTVLRAEWLAAEARHGWRVGRYVVMPDHVHFFCAALPDAKPLSAFMQRWKEWTAKRVLAALQRPAPLWQHRFFDHVLRTRDQLRGEMELRRAEPGSRRFGRDRRRVALFGACSFR